MAGNFRDKIDRFMVGRNGADMVARDFSWLAMVSMAICFIVGAFDPYVYSVTLFVTFALVIYSNWRIMSKNLSMRSEENRRYVAWKTKVTAPIRKKWSFFKLWKANRKEYRVYCCEECGQFLRVPKGKGTIRVLCPKCKSVFTSKS